MGEAFGLEHQAQLGDLSLLLLSQMAGVATLGLRGGGGKVIVVVLGVELLRGGWCSHFATEDANLSGAV